MFSKSSWLHLRIPFSYFLLPVYLFALASSADISTGRAVVVFICLHIFLYPASNGYNSYFDRDKGSIGGLKNPPKVDRSLYYLALLFDLIALIISAYNIFFFLGILIYGLVSKAYSHPSIRVKKYPFGSWFIAGLFQGFFTYVTAYIGLTNLSIQDAMNPEILIPGILTSLMLWGSYPMTQIYQHEEDAGRGDITLSLRLGVIGTFHFVAIMFSITSALFFLYFSHNYGFDVAVIYLVSMGPVIFFFFYWYFKTRKSHSYVSFENTMRLNFISATSLNIFFIYLLFTH